MGKSIFGNEKTVYQLYIGESTVEKRLIANEEHIKTLIGLGLSGTQARICLALSIKGTSTVKEIADASNVARPDTYRALLELEGKALIEKSLTNPTRYKLLPLPEVLSILMGQKEAENIRIQGKVSELLQDYQKKLADKEPENKGEFVLVPNGKAFTNRLNKLLEKCSKSVCIISYQKKLDLFLDGIQEKLSKASGKEVNVRIVTEKKRTNSLTYKLHSLQKNASLESRFADVLPPFSLAVFDEKEVLLLMTEPDENSQSTATYSNNPSLVELSQNYFNDAWFAAAEPSSLSFKRTPQQFDNLYTNMLNGFAYCKMLFDNEGKPTDFVHLQINQAFERITGLKRGQVLGKRATRAILGIKEQQPEIFEIYGRVSCSGKAEEHELYFKPLRIWLHLSVYAPIKGYFAVVFEDITERKQAEQALLESLSLIDTIFASVKDAIITFNLEGEVLNFNEAFLSLYEFKSKDEAPKTIQEFANIFDVSTTGNQATDFVSVVASKGETASCEFIVKRKSTGQRWVVNHTFSPLRNEKGQRFGMVLSLQDVTHRKRSEEKIQKLNRTLKAISNANRALLHATDEVTFMQEGCRLIQENCGYKMVWIGLAMDDEAKTVVPAAYAGFDKGFLETLNVSWAENEAGQCPTGRAIRTGQPQFHSDIASDPSFNVWRKEALRRGYVSYISIPLKSAEKTFGNITIYTSEPNSYSEDEVNLLTEIADDIAYGIAMIRLRREKEQNEKEREIMLEFLPLINKSSGIAELMEISTEFIKQKSGCQAVGIRLKEGQDYPYSLTKGFPPEHVKAENKLTAHDAKGNIILDFEGNPILECMCGNVINGKTDPAKPFFTQKGSFWTNSTTQLLASTTDADRQARTRNNCNKEGYESVALIALTVGKERIGLMQINDKRKGIFTLEAIKMWERIADHLALALSKTMAEEQRLK